MYSIILTTIVFAQAGHSSGENINTAVSTIQIGSYKDSKTCDDIAKQLRPNPPHEGRVKVIKTAQCVQVKDKP